MKKNMGESRRPAASQRRHRVPWLAVFGALAVCAGCGETVQPSSVVRPGDEVAGLTDGERGSFLLGRALFERLATADEGLGPLYNAERCLSCHDQPAAGGGGTAVPVLKATRWADGTCDPLIASGGDNVQLRATAIAAALGVMPEEVPSEATDSALVIAPPLFGLGLLEAVPDEALESWADPDDEDGDGISGRVPRLADGRIARFGRKADATSVAGFIEAALRFELGLTTPVTPVEETRNGVAHPVGADPMPEPEIDEEGLDLLTAYVRFLGAPAQAEVTDAEAEVVELGGRLFDEIGCSGCHRSEMVTGFVDTPALSSKAIRPYSDLLLHDLGGGAGDVCTPGAAPGEYRTAPLWGLRYRQSYMHDGLAADLLTALSRHGGEAEHARDSFLSMSDSDRAAVLFFLDTL